MKNLDLTSTTVAYDSNKPIRETIKASGKLVVNGVAGAVDAVNLSRKVLALADATLTESLIEARVDARKAEIAGLHELKTLEAEYAKALASLK